MCWQSKHEGMGPLFRGYSILNIAAKFSGWWFSFSDYYHCFTWRWQHNAMIMFSSAQRRNLVRIDGKMAGAKDRTIFLVFSSTLSLSEDREYFNTLRICSFFVFLLFRLLVKTGLFSLQSNRNPVRPSVTTVGDQCVVEKWQMLHQFIRCTNVELLLAMNK